MDPKTLKKNNWLISQSAEHILERGTEMDGHSSIVTGGAGFIGSHLTERLLKEAFKVTVLDNFSAGKIENLEHVKNHPHLVIVKKDLKGELQMKQMIDECEVIYHLAANPEVRVGETQPKVHFDENIKATFNLLESIRQAKTQKTIVFTSTSTVYGETNQIPTPEEYAPLIPISTYGASKLACEALITSYAYTFNHKALILRLANVIGRKSNHGVIADFIKKIRGNPNELEIMGDGKQEKSYIHVEDCIKAIMHLTAHFSKTDKRVEIYNIGSSDRITVREIAKIVSSTMNRPRIDFKFTGGIEGGRGWKGDIKTMQLSIEKLLKTGWKPRHNSRQSVELAVNELYRTQEVSPT
jgi:UDP-glucose 4-epimerase